MIIDIAEPRFACPHHKQRAWTVARMLRSGMTAAAMGIAGLLLHPGNPPVSPA
jgi:hypothetical protein